ncbi:MAG: zf-HC2 domain-containing protein [Verrucomicrobiales bacterium]|nr:zf-HC2 domain-containing protein [Verrucomicrobiales bacterium]
MKALLGWLKWRSILVLAALTPSCRQVARLASRRYEHPLGPWMRLRIRVHLSICDACERYLRQLDVLHEAAGQLGEKFPSLGTEARLAAEAKERLKARLRCEKVG